MTFTEIQVIFLIVVGIIVIITFLSVKTITIRKDEVGIVIKTLSLPFQRSLPSHQQIALHGEPGIQAKTLSPGQHWSYPSWMYTIRKVPRIKIPPGEIGLVYAKYGDPIPAERQLGRLVDCQNFQNARAFLTNGGQKGRQLGILTDGIYTINTELFEVITSSNLDQYNGELRPEDLRVYRVDSDQIGVVTTYDGASLPAGEIAAPSIADHNNFQNGQKFIDGGGYKGLQEEVLSAGAYNLNPWFVKVKLVPLTHIPAGTVGVVISNVGKTVQNRDRLVERGYKGIWEIPIYPGKHAINPQVMEVIIVPTNPIALEWNNQRKPPKNYDAKLRALKLRSKEGFLFEIEVTQIIRIKSEQAPQMILSIGVPPNDSTTEPISSDDSKFASRKYPSIRDLVIKVLEPTIGSYFRASAQHYHAMDFHRERDKRQIDAQEAINTALSDHGVEGVDTLIDEIALPDELEKILQERKFSEERRKNYENELLTEKAHQIIEIAKAEAGVRLAHLKAMAKKEETAAEADAIRQKGEAEITVLEQRGEVDAKIVEALVNHLGREGYLSQLGIEQLGQIQLPDIVSGDSPFLSALLAPMIRNQAEPKISEEKRKDLLEEIAQKIYDNPSSFGPTQIFELLKQSWMPSVNSRVLKLPLTSDTDNTTEVNVVIEENKDNETEVDIVVEDQGK